MNSASTSLGASWTMPSVQFGASHLASTSFMKRQQACGEHRKHNRPKSNVMTSHCIADTIQWDTLCQLKYIPSFFMSQPPCATRKHGSLQAGQFLKVGRKQAEHHSQNLSVIQSICSSDHSAPEEPVCPQTYQEPK